MLLFSNESTGLLIGPPQGPWFGVLSWRKDCTWGLRLYRGSAPKHATSTRTPDGIPLASFGLLPASCLLGIGIALPGASGTRDAGQMRRASEGPGPEARSKLLCVSGSAAHGQRSRMGHGMGLRRIPNAAWKAEAPRAVLVAPLGLPDPVFSCGGLFPPLPKRPSI